MDSVASPAPTGVASTVTTTKTAVGPDGSTTIVRTTKTVRSASRQSLTRHVRRSSLSTDPKVVPPFYTHTPRRCSWEEGYNFTPKIHPYRNVQGVVRRTWTEPSITTTTTTTGAGATAATDALARNDVAHVSPQKPVRGAAGRVARRQAPARPPWNSSRHVESGASTASSRSVSAPTPVASRTSSAGRAAEVVRAEVASTRARYTPRPAPPPKAHVRATAVAPPPPRPASATPAAAARSTRRPPAPVLALPARAHAPAPFVPTPPPKRNEAASSAAGLHTTTTTATPTTTRAETSRYQPRTCAAYTLPCDYATQSWTLEQRTAPDVVVEGSSRHRWGDPAKPNTLYLNRHLRQHTRHALLHTYSAEARRQREDRYRRALARTGELHAFLGEDNGTGDGHNFNLASGADLFEDNAEHVAASFYAKETRMRTNLIEGIAPLERVLAANAAATQTRVDAPPPGTRTITAVLDDGHACSPILLQTSDNAHLLSDSPALREGTAVLVRPCTPQELPSSWRNLCAAEAARVLPKGREWDRQHAIQLAVGATTQEAIIDLLIDPRYRRPGEYLRQRGGGGGGRRKHTSHPFAA